MTNNLNIISAYRGMLQYVKAVREAERQTVGEAGREEAKLTAREAAKEAIRETEGNSESKDLMRFWLEHVIDPYWDQWAAGQFNEERIRSDMTNPIEDIDGLEDAVLRLNNSDIESILQEAYQKILKLLPLPYDEGDKVVCIYTNTGIDEALHGVLGTCVGDSILIQINPSIDGWQKYVPWVLAHEYNHTIWGFHYYYRKGNHSQSLLTSIITEGEADSFGKAICPDISPSWIRVLTPEQEKTQWEALQEYLSEEDGMELHIRFFFGDGKADTPSNTGYTIGYHIVQLYLKSHPEVSFTELIEKDAMEILQTSGYKGIWTVKNKEDL